MRVLLVAYDFPPTQSPRALRWRYLSRELALLGHEVHVLVPDLGEPGIELPSAPGRVVLHRIFPGPLAWTVAAAGRRRSSPAAGTSKAPAASDAVRLNWRGRVVDTFKRAAGLLLFPDVRAEWTPWARRALENVLATVRPDVVITSHEPASTLPLGIHARQLGFPWVADLGDPVCAAYTPRRWQGRALALETRVATLADRVIVTTEATGALLAERHGQQRRCVVIPNGYDDRRARNEVPRENTPCFDKGRLELLYAGRLYGYRDPGTLLRAIRSSPDVRLTLVVPDPPAGADGIMAGTGENLRVLGPLPHQQVQRMLERADVLVNLGDRGQPVRIAAKLYEYLGSDRPILHVRSGDSDAAANLLGRLNRGWLCDDDAGALTSLIAELRQRKRDGTLRAGLMLDPLPEYGHSSLGLRLAEVLQEVLAAKQGAMNPSTGAGL